MTKGQRATRHSLVRRAHEAMLHSMTYAYFHRRERKGDMRRMWIVRINAAAKANGVKYSDLINALNNTGMEINRKMLAEIASRDPAAFTSVVEAALGKANSN